jgi:RNA polymerase sigma-70 factor (ECF subfamily)
MTAEEFNRVYRAHLTELTRFLARRLPSEAVEDIAGDLFEIAWNKRSSIRAGEELPWLYKTARYLIANHRRKQSGRLAIIDRLREPVAAPSAESVALADLAMADAWQALPEKEREALALWALEGLEPSQIAFVLGQSENAVNVRLSRAKKNLLVAFEKTGEETT